MKKLFTFLCLAMLVVSAVQMNAQDSSIYPGLTEADTIRLYQAPRATVPPVIDGDHTDAVWDIAPWKYAYAVSPLGSDWIDGTPVAPEGAFSGPEDVSMKYKIIWDENHYYMLFRYTDDKIIYSDIHNAYRAGSIPEYAIQATNTNPAVGAGDGTMFQAFRMDQFSYWLTPYTDNLKSGAQAYNRNNNGLFHVFLPGKLTHSTRAEAVLWAPRHNPVATAAGSPQTHQATVAGRFVEAENAYYVEFRDTTWTTLFSSVRTKLPDQKDFSASGAEIGDKFLLQGEANDADGITNRRDYVLRFSAMSDPSAVNPLTNLSEALVVELVETVSSVNKPKAKSVLEMYPNPNAGNVLNLNRVADIKIFNLSGQLQIDSRNASTIDISRLNEGVYMVKDGEGNVSKLVRK